MTTAVYIRVSTAQQNEESQRVEVQKWLDGHGITARWFEDKATGRNLDRPAFKEMQAAIFSGEVRTVVVWKLDRLSRSLRDGINVLTDWIEQGVRVVSVTQQLDFNGPTGKILLALLLAMGEWENETRAERQRVGIDAAKKRGAYKNNGGPRGVKATPERIARMRELADEGKTKPEIARFLGLGLRTVQRHLSLEAAPDVPESEWAPIDPFAKG